MNINNRIKALRIQNHLTQQELGDAVQVSVVSIRCWESGTKSPSLRAIIALSEIFKVSTDFLLGVSAYNSNSETFPLSNREAALLRDYRILDYYGMQAVDSICSIEKNRVNSLNATASTFNTIKLRNETSGKYIPKYITPSAAGSSMPVEGEDFEMIPVDDNTPDDADFAVKIQGLSMYPYINDGATVFVKRDCELINGDVGIFAVDGAMYCKQYYIDNERNLTLASANPDYKHTNIFIGNEGFENLKCYGKVLLKQKVSLPDYLFN